MTFLNHFGGTKNILSLASNHQTPFYLYSQNLLEHNANEFINVVQQNLTERKSLVAFSVKSCPNINILRILKRTGVGFDCVSGNEIKRCIHAGGLPSNIIFAGVGKSYEELKYAISLGIKQINVESIQELDLISSISQDLGKVANIGIRINPDVNAKTHSHITTGNKENKFGIHLADVYENLDRIMNLPHLNIQGFCVHIGSQVTDLTPIIEGFKILVQLTKDAIAKGFHITTIDFGGGIGVQYTDADQDIIPLDEYIKASCDEIRDIPQVEVIFEPGRYISSNAGLLVSKVLYTKENEGHHFAILDTGMNDIMRPALYDAQHAIENISPTFSGPKKYDIVGPICESTCKFLSGHKIALESGNIIIFYNAGAYCASMGNNYNSKPLCAEIIFDNQKNTVIRKRQSFEDIVSLEII